MAHIDSEKTLKSLGIGIHWDPNGFEATLERRYLINGKEIRTYQEVVGLTDGKTDAFIHVDDECFERRKSH
jgi:hypothetical protein